MSSFQTQYGLRLSREINDMPWEEFCQLLSGIGPDTPLGRIVTIRSETDQNMIDQFTPEQHRIWNEWRFKRAKKYSEKDMKDVLNEFKRAFIAMAGGDTV